MSQQGLSALLSKQPPFLGGVAIPVYEDVFVETRSFVREASGFKGSAGVLLVRRDACALVVDSRYTVQAKRECVRTGCDIVPEWPVDFFPKGLPVGLDLRCVSESARVWIEKKHNISLMHHEMACSSAPVDGAIVAYPAAVSFEEKIQRVRDTLRANDVEGAMCCGADMLSWFTNTRQPQRAYTPASPLGIMLVSLHDVVVCVEAGSVSALQELLPQAEVVALEAYAEWVDRMSVKRWSVDACSVRAFDVLTLPTEKIVWEEHPWPLWKACKDAQELEGARKAHVLDGCALARFMSTLPQGVGEVEYAQTLERVRARCPHYWGPSFPTISAFGPNSAVVHYRPEMCNAPVKQGVYLLDAGGQYDTGTTDMTRTIFFGSAPQEFKHVYTNVLQAHIALARARFPMGTQGAQLDALARSVLWRYGRDYGHGTGHGVGASLNVHEGPASISEKSYQSLQPGMIVSIEPGYYKEGVWGVRLENLYYVCVEDSMCVFRPLTVVPFDNDLLDVSMMTPDEVLWLNQYHTFVQNTIKPQVCGPAQEYVLRATQPL